MINKPSVSLLILESGPTSEQGAFAIYLEVVKCIGEQILAKF